MYFGFRHLEKKAVFKEIDKDVDGARGTFPYMYQLFEAFWRECFGSQTLGAGGSRSGYQADGP